MRKQLLLFLLMLLPVALNAYDTKIDGIYYNLNSTEKTAEVTCMYEKKEVDDIFRSDYSGEIVIPEVVRYNSMNYTVTSISPYTFYSCTSLTSIEIPNSVSSIGGSAFYGTAWYNNQPDGVVYAGKVAYKYKGEMPANTSITIKDGTLSISEAAFWGCSGLTSIEIPNSVTSIGGSAFSGCSGLTSIEIPNSVTSIGSDAFYNCSSLTSIEIPNSVTSIGSDAFYNCSSLTSIEIPNSVTSIGNYAFSGTAWYNNQPDGVVYAGKVAYEYKGEMPANTSITIKDGTLSISDYAFNGCKGLTSIEIPNSVASIGSFAFSRCSGLTSVTIPNSVTSIGGSAFSRCSGLTSITIPNSVTSIGRNAFFGCSGLTSITIPSSVTSIGESAFLDCSGFASIRVEEGNAVYDSRNNCNAIVETVSNTILLGCKSTTIPNSVTSIDGYAFSGCSGLTSIEIPNSVTSIGGSAFSGCSGLTSIEIPNSVTSIDNWAFSDCSGLTSIEIPNSVTSIGVRAFSGCSSLTSITIPSSVTSIDGYAFSGCSGLTSITIPNSVTSIGYQAFYRCSSLTSIEIPNSVTRIGNRAFSDCTSLTSVVSLIKEPVGIDSDAFTNRANATLRVPKGSRDAYAAANYWKEFKEIREIEMGDVNLDDNVDRTDMGIIVDCIMGENTKHALLADVNGDNGVNAADVVKDIDIMNSFKLSTEWGVTLGEADNQQVITSITCTLSNERNSSIDLKRCEFYCDGKLISFKAKSVTMASGASQEFTFSNLSKSLDSSFSVVWQYTCNGASFSYRSQMDE